MPGGFQEQHAGYPERLHLSYSSWRWGFRRTRRRPPWPRAAGMRTLRSRSSCPSERARIYLHNVVGVLLCLGLHEWQKGEARVRAYFRGAFARSHRRFPSSGLGFSHRVSINGADARVRTGHRSARGSRVYLSRDALCRANSCVV